VVGRELGRVGEKLCGWVVGMLFGIKEQGQWRKIMERRKEREA
jgi:hypothetical protein